MHAQVSALLASPTIIFSDEIPIIPRLQFLELAFNNFNGNLPNFISKLKSLELLDLIANKLSGPIPGSLCTYNISKSKVLYLQDDYFPGTMPHSLSNCTNLVSHGLILHLHCGSIFKSVGSLFNLSDLIMWQNNLYGEIPDEYSSLKSLRKLYLDYNSLTVTIHVEIRASLMGVWRKRGSSRGEKRGAAFCVGRDSHLPIFHFLIFIWSFTNLRIRPYKYK
jgi:hypothetical protein